MEIMNRENLIEKLQKILALAARGGTEAEACTAMAKAQELLALHGLSMSDVDGHVRQADRTIDQVIMTGARFDWRGTIASGIGKLCFCFVVNCTGSKGGMLYIGKQSDVAVASELARMVIETGEKLAREMPAANSFRRSFLRGFGDRIAARCADMVKAPVVKTSTGTDLILHPLYARAESNGREYADKQLGMRLISSRSYRRGPANGAGYNAGRAAANGVSLGRNGVTSNQRRIG